MTRYLPPHKVTDPEKLQNMIDTLKSVGKLPAVVVFGDQAFSGSHRIAAWDACDLPHDAVEISDEDYIAALDRMGLDWERDDVKDYTDFCDALAAVTHDLDVKAAIADQRS